MQVLRHITLLPRLLLLFLARTLLELLRLLERLLNRLAHLALLLARLNGDGDVLDFAVLGRFADGALGILPVCCAGADFVSACCVRNYSKIVFDVETYL
jgi:hypothetical protein